MIKIQYNSYFSRKENKQQNSMPIDNTCQKNIPSKDYIYISISNFCFLLIAI